jgi:hypothetical protein
VFLLWNFADRFLSFIDVVKVEAGDLVNVTGIVATDASFDDLETITERVRRPRYRAVERRFHRYQSYNRFSHIHRCRGR